MKNFDLEKLGLQEMNKAEQAETNGGWVTAGIIIMLIGAFLGGCAAERSNKNKEIKSLQQQLSKQQQGRWR